MCTTYIPRAHRCQKSNGIPLVLELQVRFLLKCGCWVRPQQEPNALNHRTISSTPIYLPPFKNCPLKTCSCMCHWAVEVHPEVSPSPSLGTRTSEQDVELLALMSDLGWDEINSSWLWRHHHTGFPLLWKNYCSIVLARPRGSGYCLGLLV